MNVSSLATAGFLVGSIVSVVPSVTYAAPVGIVLDVGAPGTVLDSTLGSNDLITLPILSTDFLDVPANGDTLDVTWTFNDGNLLELSPALWRLGDVQFLTSISSNDKFNFAASLSLLDAFGAEIVGTGPTRAMDRIGNSFFGAEAEFNLPAATLISGFRLVTETPDDGPGQVINPDFTNEGPSLLDFTFSGTATVTTPAPVPLPATAWLFASALIGAGIVGRRKKKPA